jgi:hypothetical protein
MKITFAIISVSRPIPYIHDTLQNLMSGGPLPVHLMIGNQDNAYVNAYRNSQQVTIHDTTEVESKELENQSLRHKAVWNYSRALNLEHDGDYLMVIEDDVKFSKGWLPYLHKILTLTGDKLVTLYAPDSSDTRSTPFDFPKEAFENGLLYAQYPLAKFYGTQAMVYTKKVAKEISEFFQTNIKNGDVRPIDWLVRDFAKIQKTEILCAAPVIAQHMGKITTGLAGRDHQSHCFVEDVKKL